MDKKTEKIIVKYLTNSANENELEYLANWITDIKNAQFFDRYIETNYALDMAISKFDSKGVKKTLAEKIRREKSIFYKYRLASVFKYAAVAIICLGLGYFYQQGSFTNKPVDVSPIIVNNQIETGTDKATLTLETGEEITLEKGTAYQTENATSNGEEIIYEVVKTSNPKPQTNNNIAYNTLTIPRGGQFFINLADGTKVWLNSESQLKYPVAFTDGETRQVELIYGEAYFDVSPSTNHKGSKFQVYHNAQEVEVLGTEFNIKAYKDEINIYTTLVEGKVAVNYSGENKILAPSQQSNLDIQTNSISIAIVNVNMETSWKEGVFIFKKMPLKDLMKVLSRWYDMDVVFINKNLEDERFIGTFNKSHSIEQILSSIKNTNFINNYEINNKTIIIK